MGLGSKLSSGVRDWQSAIQWNRNSRGLWRNWWDSDLLRQYVNEQICSRPGREDGIAEALRNHLNGRILERGISIGCGDAKKELALLASGVVRKFDLYDISAGQVAAGKAASTAQGVEDRVHFLERSPLLSPPAPIYDLIYWDHSLHHMFDVRPTLEWCKAALALKGVLCVNDYVGPTRLQWTGREARRANAILSELGKKHGVEIRKVSKGNPVKRLRLYLKDPSEAPQSDRIESACAEVFPGFRLRPLGGAMLNMCGSMVMGLETIPEGLLQDFAAADRQCADAGMYHFAFGIWERP
jgi:SAM-dependent methyltransferase